MINCFQDWSELLISDIIILLEAKTKAQERAAENENFRQALILCKIHNSTVSIVSALTGKRAGKQLKPKDFMPKKRTSKSWREMKDTLEGWLRG